MDDGVDAGKDLAKPKMLSSQRVAIVISGLLAAGGGQCRARARVWSSSTTGFDQLRGRGNCRPRTGHCRRPINRYYYLINYLSKLKHEAGAYRLHRQPNSPGTFTCWGCWSAGVRVLPARIRPPGDASEDAMQAAPMTRHSGTRPSRQGRDQMNRGWDALPKKHADVGEQALYGVV